MLAPGAMAWAHSTSRAISVIQPALAAGIVRAAGLIHLGQDGVGQAELQVELVQVVGDVRIVVGVDDGDGRAAAVAGHGPAVEGILLKP